MSAALATPRPAVADAAHGNALAVGSTLGEYRVERVLGAGGFGITYLAWDRHLEKQVAIKEYLPGTLAVRALDGSVVPVATQRRHDYAWGLDRFVKEARTLARFSHPHIVRVNRYFEENGTAYMVMDYEAGEPFGVWLRNRPRPDEACLRSILFPLLDGLEAVHAEGFLHRDIKPSNIFIRENGKPVLLDFGSARQANGNQTRTLTSIVSPGYAPLEQYASDGNQGPWTDIYSLAGVMYRAMLSENPPEAAARVQRDVLPERLERVSQEYGRPFLEAVRWGLALDERRRPQAVRHWRPVFLGEQRSPEPAPAAVAVAGARAAGTAAPTQVSAAGASTTTTTVPATRTVATSPIPLRGHVTQPPGAMRWLGIGLLAAAVVGYGLRDSGRPATPARPVAADQSVQVAGPVTSAGSAVAAGPAVVTSATGLSSETTSTEDPTQGGIPPAVLAEFRQIDADRNGRLTRDEAARRAPRLAGAFDRVDTDGDGTVSPRELRAFIHFDGGPLRPRPRPPQVAPLADGGPIVRDPSIRPATSPDTVPGRPIR